MNDQKAFPFDYDDRELKEELQKLAKSLQRRDSSSAQVDVPFVQLGIVELQSRITSKLTNIVEAQSQTSSRLARKSLVISVLSFVISCLSLIIVIGALYISIKSIRFSSGWEQNQLNLLHQMLAAQKDTNKNLSDLNRVITEHKSSKEVDRSGDGKKKPIKTR